MKGNSMNMNKKLKCLLTGIIYSIIIFFKQKMNLIELRYSIIYYKFYLNR
jgi:hypothetical protein